MHPTFVHGLSLYNLHDATLPQLNDAASPQLRSSLVYLHQNLCKRVQCEYACISVQEYQNQMGSKQNAQMLYDKDYELHQAHRDYDQLDAATAAREDQMARQAQEQHANQQYAHQVTYPNF